MGGIYRPGWESKIYRHYSRTKRSAIASKVDALFRDKTGVARRLDPTSSKDLELRRIWLRIRDEVVAKSEEEIDKEWYKPGGSADQLEADRKDSLLTEIPYEMEWNHWKEGAELLETWFERPLAIAPNYSAPVTNIIKIDWVLQFPRAKAVFDEMLKNRIWTNPASQTRLAEIFKQKTLTGSTFGDLSRPVTEIDERWVNSRPVSSGATVDALTAALGGFTLQVAVAGKALRQPTGAVELTIEEIGIYVKDSFDFNGPQFLGVWGYRDDPVNNEDFRKWRAGHQLGGDFQVFSDAKRIRRNPPEVVRVTS
jgi:hypothetical protein